MKFTVSTSTLIKQLQIVSGVISNNTVIPILQDFLFELSGSQLTVSASDLETSISSSIEVNAEREGRVAIPSKILIDIVKILAEQPITVDIDENTLAVTIQTQNGVYKMAAESADEFPTRQSTEGSDSINLSLDVMTTAINKTLFAASNDELRPQMTGIFFDLEESKITFVATDAHKLVKYSEGINTGHANRSFIVPKKAMNLLKNALANAQNGSETEISIGWNEKNVFFSFEGIKLDSRLIVGTYPDYNTVIPANNPHLLTVDQEDFQNAIKRISIFSSKSTYQVILDIQGDTLRLSAQDLDFSNEAHETMSCEYEGENMQIAFNARYLLELLNSVGTTQVQLKLSHPSRACLVVPTSDENTSGELVMLVMPLMINT